MNQSPVAKFMNDCTTMQQGTPVGWDDFKTKAGSYGWKIGHFNRAL